MIIWIADRFGMPGNYHRIWLRLLVTAGLHPPEFRILKLSNALPRTLLCRLGSRKAPTWVPDEKPAIVNQVDQWCNQLQPRAVVLSSPESLAYLDMAPEHATLHNLRGSVYWRRGIPFIVSLPLSAWTSLVSQKDIGAANYGYESAEAFGAARSEDGEVYEDSDQRISRSFHRGENESQTGREGSARNESGDSDGRTLPSAGTRIELDGFRRSEHSVETEAGQSATDADSETDSDDDDGGEDIGVAESTDESDARDEHVGASGDSGSDISLASDEEDDKDRFFYEPVLSPVGRFVLTADMQKLARILDKGKKSSGPSEPIRLKY